MDRMTAMEVFAEVARLKSFAAAARALDLSTTAVSRHVRQLEDHLGARLLDRTTRHLRLTEAGQTFYDGSAKLVADTTGLFEAIRDQQGSPRGRLRVSAPMSFGHRHVMPAIPGFLDAHEGMVLDIALADRFVDLIEEGFDLALRIGKLPDSTLVAARLAPCRFALVAAPEYLARKGTPGQPADLARHNCILDRNNPAGGHWPFHGDGGPIAVPVTGNLVVSDADAALEAVVQGGGIGLIPTFMLGGHVARGRLMSLMFERIALQTAAYAVYPHNRYLTAKARVFVDFLRSLYGDPPYWDRQPWTNTEPAGR